MVEDTLSVSLPKDLKELLQESNGINESYGFHIIWSVEEIVRYNQEMRTLSEYKDCYMSFTDLLFFADAGNGDRFAFPIVQGKVKEDAVFAWDHEDDRRREIASSLRSYLEGWLSGEIHL